jgi:hypothetical protein
MWLGLGLTPANYAYVEPFRDEMREWRRQGFAAEYIQNSSYMEAMQRNRERKERLVGDIDLGEEDKMGEKEVAMLNLETNMDNNKVLHDIAMYHAMSLKRDSLQMYLDDAPHDEQPITEWPADGFRPLKKK